jgi:hypothetical protein
MILKEFTTIVGKYDPDVGDLDELVIQNLSVEIASASSEHFAALPEHLWARVSLIAAARVAAHLFSDEGDDGVEVHIEEVEIVGRVEHVGEDESLGQVVESLDHGDYEFAELEFNLLKIMLGMLQNAWRAAK